jgi:hypothetical protein
MYGPGSDTAAQPYQTIQTTNRSCHGIRGSTTAGGVGGLVQHIPVRATERPSVWSGPAWRTQVLLECVDIPARHMPGLACPDCEQVLQHPALYYWIRGRSCGSTNSLITTRTLTVAYIATAGLLHMQQGGRGLTVTSQRMAASLPTQPSAHTRAWLASAVKGCPCWVASARLV